MFDATCCTRLLRQLMNEDEIACCATKEGRRGGRSDFQSALGLHFRMLRLIEVMIKHCERCNYLFVGMLTTRPKNSIRFRGCNLKQGVAKHS